MTAVETFTETSLEPAVRGFLNRPESESGETLILTHGAGGNAQMPLLAALAEAFAGAGFRVLRANLPFRQLRPSGPPRAGDAARDRAGLENTVSAMKTLGSRRIFLGGQSYGGRQASMLSAERKVADGLLLLSYPLHPPGRRDQPRTQHFGDLAIPVMFVHGTRDPFGTIEEIESARKLIPAKTHLFPVEGAGHDLGFKGEARRGELPGALVEEWERFLKPA
ncbi:MAG: dienelactone hydrolase family protein [Acidobacteria bacterium]|nr:dienelactone hydrolase family protein [Acidobacteriota bacterium]